MKHAIYLTPILSLLAVQALHAQNAPAPSVPPKKVVIIPINGEINTTQTAFVKRAVERARNERPDLVIFEIDTPGGRVDAMQAISDHITGLDPVPTVAFIRPSADQPWNAALSAGVYISISCKRIYMYPGSVIGAATPVLLSPQGPIELPAKYQEKISSAFRVKFGEMAQMNGYPKNLAMMMVDDEWSEVFEVTVKGKKRYLTKQEIEQIEIETGESITKPQHPLLPLKKLLTVGAQDALKYGLATKIIRNRAEIYPEFGLSDPTEITEKFSWSEDLVGWLTNPLVASILTIIGILGIWVELKTPGFGIPGIVGILSFAILLFGHHLVGMAEYPKILLVVLGLALIAVELFLIPGTGIFAILGVICFFAGLILSMSFQGLEWPKGRVAWEALQGPTFIVMGSFVIAAIAFVILLRYLPHVPLFGRLALMSEISSTAVQAPEVHSQENLLNKAGVALTSLRPAGKVDIDGVTIDVIAHGDFIEKGEKIHVIQVEGTRIVVDRLGHA